MQFVRMEIAAGLWPVSLLYARNDGGNHRRTVTPDDDISDLPAKAQQRIEAHWAGMDRNEWQAKAHPPAPPATAADVKAEMRRRVDLVADADERADMALEWNALRDKQAAATLSDADKARGAQLEAAWQAIQAIKAAGKALATQEPIPADYAASARWPS